MKKLPRHVVGWLGLMLLLPAGRLPAAHALETGRSSLRSVVRPPCDEVCELKSQDAAFQLLVEAYRQYRCHQIETQYDARREVVSGRDRQEGSLVIATSLEALSTVRDWLMLCIDVDRDRQLRDVSTKVAQMRVAYSCVRRADEEDVGQEVPLQATEMAASELLRQFDLIAFGSADTGPLRLVNSVPAKHFLCNPPRRAPDLSRVAEACDRPEGLAAAAAAVVTGEMR